MFKSPSFRAFNRPNGRRRSQIQDNDTTITRDMSPTVDSANNSTNSFSQRLMRTRTNTSKGKGELSPVVNSTPNSRPATRGNDDHADNVRPSNTNDSPLSFTGSTQFYHNESPSRSANSLSPNGSGSRNPSTASVNSSNRRSAALDPSDVDVAAAIALLQELKKRASPEDLIALHKALLPTRNVITSSPAKPESSDVDEPLSPMIRRSSLLPAGVKTRLSRELLRNFSDQSIPARSTSQGPRPSPDLKRPLDFEALDLADEAIEAQAARAATPPDFCPQVGTYKLGSLRITNGSASPEPSLLLNMAERARAPESVGGDGFVTADEGESSPVSVQKPRLQPREGPRHRSSEDFIDDRARSQSRAPLRVDTFRENSDEEADSRNAGQSSRSRAQKRISDPSVPDYAAEFEMPNPHFSIPPLTTRLSTVHDESPTEENNGDREDALRKLNGEPTYSDARRSTGQRYLGVARPPMHAKSDSGYSSEASRRPNSIVKESHVDEFLLAAISAADQAERTRPCQPTTESSRSSLDNQRPENIHTARVMDVRALSATQKADRHRSMPSFFSNSRKTASSTSVNTIASTSTTPTNKQSKKLQKSRPQSRHGRSATSQVELREEAETEPVPALPEDTSVNFSRRMVRAHTSQVDGSFAPKDQPQRGSAEDDDDRRGRDRGRKQDKNFDRSPEGSTRRSFFRFRSRSRSKSQHRREEPTVLSVEDEPLPTFSDFGTVAQSIGSSPYDIATRRGKDVSQYDASKPMFHPHEISGRYSQDLSEREPARDNIRDRSRSQSRARGRGGNEHRPVERFSGAETSFSKPPSRKRSTSAHAAPVSQTSKNDEGKTKAGPSSFTKGDGVRVGTIDFGNGVGQGRLAPILTPNEKAKARRRTQSVASRTRFYATSPMIPEEPMPSQGPANRSSKAPAEAQEPAPQTTEFPKSPAIERKPVAQNPALLSPKVPVQVEKPVPRSPVTRSPKVPVHVEKPVSQGPPTQSPKVSQSSNVPQSPKAIVRAKEPVSVPQSPVSPAYTSVPRLPEMPVRAEAPRPLASHPSSSPTQTASRAAMPSWESQARSWRQRRQSVGEALYPSQDKKRPTVSPKMQSSPVVEQVYTPTTPRRTPAVVVSRYITPHGSEFCTPPREDSDPYRHLYSENPTDHLPAQEDVDRTDSSSTYRTAASGKSQDSFASNDSAKYRAYRPPPGDVATVSRLMGPAVEKDKRASISSEPRRFEPKRRSTAPPDEHNVAYDRFSGGLSYAWERGSGFGGSAGTRQKGDNKASRKSVVLSENFGVDLSDVPVFFVKS